MNKRQVFNHYAHILDTLLDNTLFFPYFLQNPFSLAEDIEHPCYDLDLYLHFGATRCCIEDRTYDYVVKMDLNDRDDCENEEYFFNQADGQGLGKYFVEPIFLGVYTKSINFYDFSAIDDYLNYIDCYDEAEFENWFADNEDNFGSLHEIIISLPLYAYRRAVPHRYKETYEELGKEKEPTLYEVAARKYNSPLKERNLAIAIEFIKCYGEEEYKRLSAFLDDMGINDIHASNVADVNGDYTLIDYAGYHSIYSYSEDDYGILGSN